MVMKKMSDFFRIRVDYITFYLPKRVNFIFITLQHETNPKNVIPIHEFILLTNNFIKTNHTISIVQKL
jgi:hypothetical protein